MAAQTVKKIAVVRLGEVGDLIFILPMLQTLRLTLPKVWIVLIGFAWLEELISAVPGQLVNEYVCIDEERDDDGNLMAKKVPPELEDKLNSLRCDVALQCSALGDHDYARKLMAATSAKLKIGFSNEADDVADHLVAKPFYLHEITAHLQLLDFAEPPSYIIEPFLDGKFKKRTTIPKLLSRFDKRKSNYPYIIMHTGAGDCRRAWPAEYFAAVADALYKPRRPIILTGALNEMEYSEKVFSLTRAPLLNLSGKVSLEELLQLLGNAQLLITNDTGPLHAARALGTNTVGLYTMRYFNHAAPLFSRHDVSLVSTIVSCPLCGKNVWTEEWPTLTSRRASNTCRHKLSLLQDIKPEEVLKAANMLL